MNSNFAAMVIEFVSPPLSGAEGMGIVNVWLQAEAGCPCVSKEDETEEQA